MYGSRFHFTWLCVDIWDKYSALPIKNKKTGFRQTKTKFFVFLYYLVVKFIVHHIGISKFLHYIVQAPSDCSNGACNCLSSVFRLADVYLFVSINLCRIAAISALVATSLGLIVLSVLPFIKPLPTAHCIAEIAYSDISSKSV